MLALMGRENLEDFNADFLIMLETWEATERYLGGHGRQNLQALDIAQFLGWIEIDAAKKTRSRAVAAACASANLLASWADEGLASR